MDIFGFGKVTIKALGNSMFCRINNGNSLADDAKNHVYNFAYGGNHFVCQRVNPHEIGKLSGRDYYISPITIEETLPMELDHQDCPGKLRLEMVLRINIPINEMIQNQGNTSSIDDFGNFLWSREDEDFSKEFISDFVKEDKIFKNSLKPIIHSQNIDFLRKCLPLPPGMFPKLSGRKWLGIQAIEITGCHVLPTKHQQEEEAWREAEKQRMREAKETERQHLEELQEIERKAAVDIAKKEADAAIQEINNRNAEAENERKRSEAETRIKDEEAKQAAARTEAEREQARLIIEEKKQEIKKLEDERKVLQVESERILQNMNSDRNIALNKAKEAKIKLEQAEIEKNTAETNDKIARINMEIALEAQELQRKQYEDEKARNEELYKAKIDAIQNQRAVELLWKVVQEINDRYDRLETEYKKKIEYLNDQAVINYHYNFTPDALIDAIRKQKLKHSASVKKPYAKVKDAYFSSRDPSLGKFKHTEIEIGSSITFTFSSELAGYITIIWFGSSGKIYLIEPNCYDDVCRIEANREYSLPGEIFLRGCDDGITQNPPAGVEQLLLIVSEDSLEELFADLNLKDAEEFVTLTNSKLSAIANKLRTLEPDSWAAGYLAYNVVQA